MSSRNEYEDHLFVNAILRANYESLSQDAQADLRRELEIWDFEYFLRITRSRNKKKDAFDGIRLRQRRAGIDLRLPVLPLGDSQATAEQTRKLFRSLNKVAKFVLGMS